MKNEQKMSGENNSDRPGKILPESSMLPLWRRINNAFLVRTQLWDLPTNSAIVLLHLQISPENDEPAILADKTCFPRQTMTSALDALEKRGLATRVPHASDRRRKCVVLTPEGERRGAEMLDDLLAFEAAGMSQIPAADRKRMHEFLTRYSEALNRENEQLIADMKEE